MVFNISINCNEDYEKPLLSYRLFFYVHDGGFMGGFFKKSREPRFFLFKLSLYDFVNNAESAEAMNKWLEDEITSIVFFKNGSLLNKKYRLYAITRDDYQRNAVYMLSRDPTEMPKFRRLAVFLTEDQGHVTEFISSVGKKCCLDTQTRSNNTYEHSPSVTEDGRDAASSGSLYT